MVVWCGVCSEQTPNAGMSRLEIQVEPNGLPKRSATY
jgi:hypothetical protein